MIDGVSHADAFHQSNSCQRCVLIHCLLHTRHRIFSQHLAVGWCLGRMVVRRLLHVKGGGRLHAVVALYRTLRALSLLCYTLQWRRGPFSLFRSNSAAKYSGVLHHHLPNNRGTPNLVGRRVPR